MSGFTIVIGFIMTDLNNETGDSESANQKMRMGLYDIERLKDSNDSK